MYGLDTSIDLSFLRGREVVQIAIGIHQVIFGFDADVSITVEGAFQYAARGECSKWGPGMPDAATPTLRLLGRTVREVQGHSDGTLKIGFSNGDYLTILDASKQYESYQISSPGKTIVV